MAFQSTLYFELETQRLAIQVISHIDLINDEVTIIQIRLDEPIGGEIIQRLSCSPAFGA